MGDAQRRIFGIGSAFILFACGAGIVQATVAEQETGSSLPQVELFDDDNKCTPARVCSDQLSSGSFENVANCPQSKVVTTWIDGYLCMSIDKSCRQSYSIDRPQWIETRTVSPCLEL